MASLDFDFEVNSHDRWKTEMQFCLDEEEAKSLAIHLSELRKGARECCFRLEAPRTKDDPEAESWLMFWKLRREGSRAMVAHPAENQWVATIALENEALDKAISLLETNTKFGLDEITELNQLGNFHLRFRGVNDEQ